MTNIQEALKAAIELIEDIADLEHEEVIPVIEGLKSALSEIEKCEPVRYEWFDENTDEWIETSKTYYLQYSYDHPVRMLYTSPQPIEWVGLSYADRSELFKGGVTMGDLINATEAKLKQLNTKG